ncbi:MAG: M23 family metallopeptidase [Gemmatimonadetes bacterium]|nr:M23 family metallopeptidase [Gemmatimonadota bacterium]MYI07466.1 M23 family metallopeptidase [Gemmatimonadota bacterium]
MNRRRLSIGLLLALGALAACEQAEILEDRFRDLTPYEAYQENLAVAGLHETALALDWAAAGREALEDPIEVGLPFEEEAYITADDPLAVGYRVHVPRGRKLTFAVAIDSDEGTRLFIDLFRVPNDEEDPLRPVFSADSVAGIYEHEDPWRAGDYILRVQPELLRGGTYRIILTQEAQYAFPVEGHKIGAIQSFFGAPRDGGRRVHHGVDVFARRGTPVLAATAGTTYRVSDTNIGGKVVWVRDDERGARFYYAHLDSQYVGNGVQVEVGDTIGFVGNTGNARTTPPHLHFGVYRRRQGPFDPLPFLIQPGGTLAEMTADLSMLGSEVQPGNDGIRLRASPAMRGEVLMELDSGASLRVLGASGDWFRVRLPDGGYGYVAARLMDAVPAVLADDGGAP